MKKMLLVSMFQNVAKLLPTVEPNLKNKTITYIPTASKVEKLGFFVNISLLGVNDPSFRSNYLLGDEVSVMNSNLAELTEETNGYTILLSHRPELFDTYVSYNVDLILSGHAHGGQFRLPFIGGIVAPGQGLFPKYDAGLYSENNTSMIVSRGIGNSIIPVRVNNRPEIVVVELNR